jgi:hypothetical protein
MTEPLFTNDPYRVLDEAVGTYQNARETYILAVRLEVACSTAMNTLTHEMAMSEKTTTVMNAIIVARNLAAEASNAAEATVRCICDTLEQLVHEVVETA